MFVVPVEGIQPGVWEIAVDAIEEEGCHVIGPVTGIAATNSRQKETLHLVPSRVLSEVIGVSLDLRDRKTVLYDHPLRWDGIGVTSRAVSYPHLGVIPDIGESCCALAMISCQIAAEHKHLITQRQCAVNMERPSLEPAQVRE